MVYCVLSLVLVASVKLTKWCHPKPSTAQQRMLHRFLKPKASQELQKELKVDAVAQDINLHVVDRILSHRLLKQRTVDQANS